jgi:hypothetical protein
VPYVPDAALDTLSKYLSKFSKLSYAQTKHFQKAESEVQRMLKTCHRSHSLCVANPEFFLDLYEAIG